MPGTRCCANLATVGHLLCSQQPESMQERCDSGSDGLDTLTTAGVHGRVSGEAMQSHVRARVIAGAILTAAVAAASLAGCAAPGGPATSGTDVPALRETSPAPHGRGAASMDQAPAIPSPTAGVTADAASRAKADGWLAGAVLPPGAVRVPSPPPGTTINDQSQSWWCQPMAEADAYWTVTGMSMVEAANWLRAHPSNGLTVVSPQPETPDPALTNDSVNDFPSATASEGMTFQLATWGSDRTVIHLEIGVLSPNSTCATASPGEQLMTAGG